MKPNCSGCDHCEEWFHADCISANQREAEKLQRESKYIKKFFCSECREKNPHLSIVYKSKYAEKIKLEEETRTKEKKKDKEHKKDKHKEKHRDRDHEKEKKSKDKKSEKRRSRSRSKSKEKIKEKRDQTRPYDKHAHKHKNKDKDKDRDRDRDREREKEKSKEEKRSKAASDDPVIETIDLRNSKAEEEKIKHDPVKDDDDIVILDEPKPKKFKGEEYDKEKRIEMSQARRIEELKRERSLSTEMKSPKHKADVRKVLQPKVENDNVVNLSSSSDEWSPAVGVSRSVTAVKATAKRKASKDQRDKERVKKRSWRDVESSSDDDEIEVDRLVPSQCYGMNCVNCARVGSKYCSDQCGTSLATLRIYQVSKASEK